MRLRKGMSAWFDVPDDPDKAAVEVRYINPGEMRDIEERMERFQAFLRKDQDGVMREEVRLNPGRGDVRYAVLCAATVNWKNVFDADGQPLECTEANKVLLARDDPEFSAFVGRCRAALNERVAAAREEERKNLPT